MNNMGEPFPEIRTNYLSRVRRERRPGAKNAGEGKGGVVRFQAKFVRDWREERDLIVFI